MTHLELVAVMVHDYDEAIDVVGRLGFELIEDAPSLLTSDGRNRPRNDYLRVRG